MQRRTTRAATTATGPGGVRRAWPGKRPLVTSSGPAVVGPGKRTRTQELRRPKLRPAGD